MSIDVEYLSVSLIVAMFPSQKLSAMMICRCSHLFSGKRCVTRSARGLAMAQMATCFCMCITYIYIYIYIYIDIYIYR